MTTNQFFEMVNHESGLLGVSETSSDMRDLLRRETEDVRAAEAIALFCYQIKKWIGAFAAALGGLDTLVFAGGIGENAPSIRAHICDGLGFLGIKLEEKQNLANADMISMATSRVAIRVMRTDEELMIAQWYPQTRPGQSSEDEPGTIRPRTSKSRIHFQSAVPQQGSLTRPLEKRTGTTLAMEVNRISTACCHPVDNSVIKTNHMKRRD